MRTYSEMDAFVRDVMIWRPVVHNGDHCDIRQFAWETSSRGSFMARVALRGDFLVEPELREQKPGVVVFIDCKSPPDNWTHIAVTGKSTRAVFGRFVPGDLVEYLNFRYMMRRRMVASPREHQVSNARLITFGTGIRAFIVKRGHDDYEIDHMAQAELLEGHSS